MPAIERLGYLAEFTMAQLAGARHLVLVDARAPVSFFAYPNKPSYLVPDDCEVHVLAADGSDAVGPHATHPIVTGEIGMDLEEAAALMVQHRIRRLPLVDGEGLAGIVTLDDLAVRSGDLNLAHQMTAEVAKAALPEFFFHQRGG